MVEEARTRLRQLIDVGRVDLFVAVAAEHPGRQVIHQEEQHVGPRRRGLAGEHRQREAAEEEMTAGDGHVRTFSIGNSRALFGAAFFHGRHVRKLDIAHAIKAEDLAADFARDALGVFVGLVFQFDLEVEVGDAHDSILASPHWHRFWYQTSGKDFGEAQEAFDEL